MHRKSTINSFAKWKSRSTKISKNNNFLFSFQKRKGTKIISICHFWLNAFTILPAIYVPRNSCRQCQKRTQVPRSTVFQSLILVCLVSETVSNSADKLFKCWFGESPEPCLASPWVLEWSQPYELVVQKLLGQCQRWEMEGNMGKGSKLSLLSPPPAPPHTSMHCYPHMYAKWLGDSF